MLLVEGANKASIFYDVLFLPVSTESKLLVHLAALDSMDFMDWDGNRFSVFFEVSPGYFNFSSINT